jgi:transposase InsO family protein
MADKYSPGNTINTSFTERPNGLWRLWDAHLTRKSPLFAKSIRWLKAKLAICVATYNLIRPHGTLGGKKAFGKPATPAMAAKITDQPWKFRDILLFPAFC